MGLNIIFDTVTRVDVRFIKVRRLHFLIHEIIKTL